MYNRYIPQANGTYQRQRMAEPEQPKHEPAGILPDPPQQNDPFRHERRPVFNPEPAGFLRRLLPRDFDAGDILVVMLLLLIAGDCEKERSSALLTLALYFIM